MKELLSHKVISFLGSFLITGIILLTIYLFLALLTFNLAGGESLTTINARYSAVTVIAALLAMYGAFLARKLLFKGKKDMASGICTVLITNLITAIIVQINFQRHQPVVSTVWKEAYRKPFHMAFTLIEERALLGLSRKQVENMLGTGKYYAKETNQDSESFEYQVEDSWTMTVVLEKDTVILVSMRQPWLGI